MRPSPRFFTSMPPAAVRAARRRAKWVWRSSSAVLGSSAVDSSVDPTMSVKRMVTVCVFAKSAPPPIPWPEV